MNKLNMFVVTSACDSNLRYSLEDKKNCSYLVPQNDPFTSWNLLAGKSLKPSTLQLFDRWLREGGTGGRSCVLKIRKLGVSGRSQQKTTTVWLCGKKT